MNLEEKLYTSTEVAKVLGVSLRSVYRYLDQGKLDAEIKTATGRLRFTKQDILNFLYPEDGEGSGEGTEIPRTFEQADLDIEEEELTKKTVYPTYEKPLSKEPTRVEKEVIEEPKNPEVTEEEEVAEKEEEEIDWLAKFRAAAKEYSMEKEKSATEPLETPTRGADSLSSLDLAEEIAPSSPTAPTVQRTYYKSMLGGLKEVAQNIDKIARKSAVDYAFTLYAGLSLDKPLKKPFSVLHVYVDPSTEALFQRMLQLEESDESNAQLCLMFPQNSRVFANKVEKHGLYVVSPSQMREDFESMGLAEEFETLL